MSRFACTFLLFFSLFALACQYEKTWPDSKFLFPDKVDREYRPDANVWIRDHEFVQDQFSQIDPAGEYVSLESLKYSNPVDGTWDKSGIWKHINRADDDEEVFIFVAIVTYEKANQFEQVKYALCDPISVDLAAVNANKHNWFTPKVEASALPPGADLTIWCGYSGEVAVSSESQNLRAFVNDHRGVAADLSTPQFVQGGKHVYMKCIVLEETGHTQMRKLLKKVDAPESIQDALIDIAKAAKDQKWDVALTIAARYYVGKEIREYIDGRRLIDLEYGYAHTREGGNHRKLPLVHRRIWESAPGDPVSFEMVLKKTTVWEKPEGKDCDKGFVPDP